MAGTETGFVIKITRSTVVVQFGRTGVDKSDGLVSLVKGDSFFGWSFKDLKKLGLNKFFYDVGEAEV